ncbi:hypothetical protein ElyMa_006075400 [Elysia marginata]|uniref:Uncharacterized protein n=1 Tax=Elysia marginata TaxID=1093978 RepID=A0AAV4GPE6_9GAST|nr:hypothetical protein ElyMa_006075400 [Elysia marginata]
MFMKSKQADYEFHPLQRTTLYLEFFGVVVVVLGVSSMACIMMYLHDGGAEAILTSGISAESEYKNNPVTKNSREVADEQVGRS